jgi:hypothetical protein
MCLVTKQKKATITKRDIFVYKAVRIEMYGERETVHSPYYNHSWGREVLFTTELGISRKLIQTCDFYDSTAYSNYIEYEENENPLTLISHGFHFAFSKKRLVEEPEVRKFLIPKGSSVFKDNSGLGVSNQIMLIK